MTGQTQANLTDTVRLRVTKIKFHRVVPITFEDDVSIWSPIGQRFTGQGRAVRVEITHRNGDTTIYEDPEA